MSNTQIGQMHMLDRAGQVAWLVGAETVNFSLIILH